MAIQIGGTTVINDSKAITNVVSYSGDGVATQGEAEAGTNNDQLMTPLRVKQAIEAMAGSQLPNIQTEGWPGEDKGHAGFGWSVGYSAGGSDRNMYGAGPYGQTWGSQGPSAVSDILVRGTRAWSNNMLNAGSFSQTLEPCGSTFYQGSSAQYMVMHLATPNSIEGRTIDIYWGSANNSSTGLEFDAVSGLSYYPFIPDNGRSNFVAMTKYDTLIYQNTSANQENITRTRIPDLPDACGIRIYGSGNTTYNNQHPTICYYEIY